MEGENPRKVLCTVNMVNILTSCVVVVRLYLKSVPNVMSAGDKTTHLSWRNQEQSFKNLGKERDKERDLSMEE